MNHDSFGRQRRRSDRRARPTSPFDAFRLAGRRAWPRRREERDGAFFVDRFDTSTLALVVSLLALTIADGVLTIELLSLHSEEANPFMNYLLHRGPLAFLLGKYLLTAIGLPVIVVCKNHRMFGSRFRVGFLLPVFIGLYVILIAYQLSLFHAGLTRQPRAAFGEGTALSRKLLWQMIDADGRAAGRRAP